MTGLTIVDCSASSETIGILNQVVDLGCCIVLANKRPLSSSLVLTTEFPNIFVNGNLIVLQNEGVLVIGLLSP